MHLEIKNDSKEDIVCKFKDAYKEAFKEDFCYESFSDARRQASDARRKASDARRVASASRRKASDARRKASDARRKAALARLRDARGRFAMKGTKGAEQAQTIYMPIQQASNGKTAEAIVVRSEKEANKAGVTDVKIVEK